MRRAAAAAIVAGMLTSLLAGDGPAAAAPDERPDPNAVADLVTDLGAAEPHVRDQARDRLVKFGAAVVSDLAAALEGPSARARIEAARALGAIGARAKAAVPALEKAAGSADPVLAAAAKEALEAIASPPSAATAIRVPDVIPLLASKDAEAKRAAIRRLGEVRGPDAAAATNALAVVLDDPDLSMRAEALRALGAMGAEAGAAAPKIVDALASPNPAVRGAALDAAAKIGAAAAPPAIQALSRLHATQSDETGARPWIESALWDIGPAAAGLARVALGMADPHLGAAGADALGAIRATDAESVAALVAACAGRPAIVRRQSARALGLIGGAASETSTDALIAVLADQGGRAQVEAADALRRVLVDLGEKPARPTKVPADVQKAIEAGLDWLGAHQDEDGRWDCAGFDKHDPAADKSGGGGETVYDTGVTALALVAIARSGATGRTSGEDATWSDLALRRGLRWLVTTQAADGAIGPRSNGHFIYQHAIGTLALCEAWRRTGNPLLAAPAQRALDFLAAWRNPEGCWRYEPQAKETDTSVNGWCVQAMSAGTRAGLRADRAGDAFVLKFLDAATEAQSGRVGYFANGKFISARTDAMAKRFPPEKTASMTSSACLQRLLLGREPKTDPLLAKGLQHVLSIPPAWDDSGVLDLYSWMSATEAAFLAGGDVWLKWRKEIRDALVPSQHGPKDGAKSGSWDAADPWAPDGGRVYSTAAAVLCLEEHNGYLPPLPKDPTRDGRGLRAVRALDAVWRDGANHETVRDAARWALSVWRGL